MSSVKQVTVTLPSRNTMYMIGLGTFTLNYPGDVFPVIDTALSLGYRSFDTAAVYSNERYIGGALEDLLPVHGLTREDIRITTKLPPNQLPQSVDAAIKESIQNLRCKYIDLYLIHWPGSLKLNKIAPSQERAVIWQKLVDAQKQGLIRDIGVSNFTVRHLTELLRHPSGVRPAVNQVEWHPFCWDAELKEFCYQNGIVLQAYSSLGGSNNRELIEDAHILSIATKLRRSPAQVLLRWALQQGVAIIPKAKTRQHLEENIDLNFQIPPADIQLINNMISKRQKKYTWDPTNVE